MKNEENKDKKEEITDKIKTKIAMLFIIEERMRKSIEKMIKEASIEKKLDSAYEKTAKKLKRGN